MQHPDRAGSAVCPSMGGGRCVQPGPTSRPAALRSTVRSMVAIFEPILLLDEQKGTGAGGCYPLEPSPWPAMLRLLMVILNPQNIRQLVLATTLAVIEASAGEPAGRPGPHLPCSEQDCPPQQPLFACIPSLEEMATPIGHSQRAASAAGLNWQRRQLCRRRQQGPRRRRRCAFTRLASHCLDGP